MEANAPLQSSAPDEFAELVTRAGQGEERALSELVRRYEPEVRLTARLLLSPALRPFLDSVDLVQSVHHSVMIGLRNARFDLTRPEQLLALALTIVRRKVARQWRRVQRLKRQDVFDPKQTPFRLSQAFSTEVDPTEEAQYAEQVEKIYSKLDSTERQLIELRLQGYSTADAARVLDLDPDVLRVRLHRLRQRLRASKLVREWL